MSDEVTLEQVVIEAKRLSPEDRLRLIQRVAETLLPVQPSLRSRAMKFGEFDVPIMSSEADFAIAEWRLSDKERNGE